MAEYMVPNSMFFTKYFEVYSLVPSEATIRGEELTCRDDTTYSIVTFDCETALERRFRIQKDRHLRKLADDLRSLPGKTIAYTGTSNYGR